MDDPQIIPDPDFPQEPIDAAPKIPSDPPVPSAVPTSLRLPASDVQELGTDPYPDATARRRKFRRNLYLLLSLALTAFVLTSWILVRVDSPFGALAVGPQEIVQAQLRALDRGELRPAYDMFSARYRAQVSFDEWHDLCLAHWRMFHASVVRAEAPAASGPGVSMEIYLRGADDEDYRARFMLVRTGGRWWIDDVHWTQEPALRDFSRT
jgi:hypothetical protein